MIEFENALEDDDFGAVAELVRNSEEVLNATFEQKEDVVVSYLHNIHNSEIPISKYNDENSLSCVITLAYLSAKINIESNVKKKAAKDLRTLSFTRKEKICQELLSN